MIYILTIILSLILIIFFHELSHLLIACAVGKKPKILSVGFWKPYQSIKIKDIQFRITPFILGGFISFTDNFNKSMEEVKKLTCSKQLYIYLAGCLGNMFVGLIIFSFCCWYLFKDLTLLFKLIYENILFFYGIFFTLFSKEILTIMFLNNVTGLTLLILLFFGMLSFMTGIINLIPIPPTDGWHIIQAIIEKIKKKNFSYKV
jgi:membrane-associated protease RseP (regulator of RpoE activity)